MKIVPKEHYKNTDLFFNSEDHKYYLINPETGEKKYLNSASSLNQFNSLFYEQKSMSPIILEKAIQRGNDLHKMIEWKLQGKSFEYIGSQATKSKMDNFFHWLGLFLADKDVALIEQPLCSSTLPVAGTPDVVFWDKTENEWLLLDWKGGSKPVGENDWKLATMYEPQLNFYKFLLSENFEVDINKIRCKIVFLEDGKPKTHSF